MQGSGGQVQLLSCNKSQTGSSGNIHGLVLAAEQHASAGTPGKGAIQKSTVLRLVSLLRKRYILESTSSVTKLSTFMGGLANKGNSSMVQMRRSTNKKGKQAPAPPKRTRRVSFIFLLCKKFA